MEMESPISSETNYHSPGSYQNTPKSEHSNSKQPPQGDNHSPQGDSNSISHHSPQGDNNSHHSPPQGDNNNNNSNTNSQTDGIEAVKKKCYQICLQWLLIAFLVFFVIAKASKIGMKILKDPTSSTCLRIIYFGLKAIHVFMVYKVLHYGPQLPMKMRFQFYVMFICCGGFTTAIMFMVARDSPFDMWGWTPIVSGGLWMLAGLPLISPRVPILPL